MLKGGEQHATPHLLIDLQEIARKYAALKETLHRKTEVFYSVKANNHPDVIAELARLGSGFDVASWKEVKTVLQAGVSADKIAFSNPIKKKEEIEQAHAAGVSLFAFDSDAEVRKLAESAPGSQVYVRLVVSNEGSLWPLTNKFGVDYIEASRLIQLAAELGLKPVGATFHVGSQCLNPVNWGAALRVAAEVFRHSAKNGIQLSMINMGGGLPAMDSASNCPEIAEIKQVIDSEMHRFGENVRVLIEPGRHLVATSGTLVATVIGEADRGGKKWLYLDTGVYNGLMEIFEGFPYEIRTDRPTAPPRQYVIAGPTCDSVDVVYKKIMLPEVKTGDRLYFMNAGAYTISYDGYNGFPFPEVIHKNEKAPAEGGGGTQSSERVLSR